MLTGPITAMSQPRRKNGHEFHELYENRRAVRAAFASDRAHLATYTVCDRRKFVEFVKFVAKCLPASVLSRASSRGCCSCAAETQRHDGVTWDESQ